MGIQAKPIKKMRSILQKIRNEQLAEERKHKTYNHEKNRSNDEENT